MKIDAAKGLKVMTGDIGNVYLNENTEENICTHAGAEFELVGIMAEGTFLKLVNALYGFTTSGNMWHAYLLHTLRGMYFKTTRFDPDVWI